VSNVSNGQIADRQVRGKASAEADVCRYAARHDKTLLATLFSSEKDDRFHSDPDPD
jgi:hypothetical protein